MPVLFSHTERELNLPFESTQCITMPQGLVVDKVQPFLGAGASAEVGYV
jgi:hypothetical protein